MICNDQPALDLNLSETTPPDGPPIPHSQPTPQPTSNKRSLDEIDATEDSTTSTPTITPPTTTTTSTTPATTPATTQPPTTGAPAAKRPRTTHTVPSKVIHIRNVPMEATELELVALCAPFGKVETALIMRGKGQALVQMQDQAGATALVDFYLTNPAVLRTNMIHLQYSTREEITNKPPIHIPPQVEGGHSPHMPSSHSPRLLQSPPSPYVPPYVTPNPVLQHTNQPLEAPHPPPILAQPLQPHQPHLPHIPHQSHQSHQPHQPQPHQPHQPHNRPHSQAPSEALVLLVNVSNVTYPVTIELLHQVFSKYGLVTKIVTFAKTGFQAFVQFATHTAAEIAKSALDGQNIYVGCCTLQINYSNIKDLDIKYNNERSRDFVNADLPRHSYQIPDSQPGYPPAAVPVPHPYPVYDPNNHMGGYPPPPPNPYAPPLPPVGPPGYGSKLAAAKGVAAPGTSPVVIVSLMNEERVTPDALFTLLGVYGDVLKVKILFSKKDTALVQLATPQQAESVVAHLNGAILYGKAIRVNFSKHPTIMIPSNNEENAQFTKEYVNSQLHRFRSSPNAFKHICPPTSTLHVSSIPPSVSELELRDLFSAHGEVVNAKFFSSEKKMALVQMASVPDAIVALIALHNHRFESDPRFPIRVSFAKATIWAN